MTNETTQGVQKLQPQLELYINEQAADLQVFRLTLQVMFLTMLSNHPNKEEMLWGLKDRVIGALNNPQPSSHDLKDVEKRQQLTLMRAEEFFQEIGTVLGIADTKGGPSGKAAS